MPVAAAASDWVDVSLVPPGRPPAVEGDTASVYWVELPGQWDAIGVEGDAAGGVRILTQGWARGRRLVALALEPGSTEFPCRLRVVPTTDPPLPRHRSIAAVERRYAARLEALGVAAGPAGGTGAGAFTPSFSPSLDGSPVATVIVTTEAMAAAFQPLADWRTASGHQAVVRTIEWIEDFYPSGADRAETLRMFLEDAYSHWGTLWVVLGGDTDVIPARHAASVVQSPPGTVALIPTDLYFACLDNRWNGDGDQLIGEGYVSPAAPGDGADLMPELFVGRLPVSTADHAAACVAKLLAYEQEAPSDPSAPLRFLALAEHLDFWEGADIAETAIARLHPWTPVVKLYESASQFPGAELLTREAALDSVNAGFGWVHHVGHGFRNTMSLADAPMVNADADGLTNATQSVVFAINCSSASIDFNAIGERWVQNAAGGAVAYVGTTRLAFPLVSERYQNEFYALAFGDSVPTAGECLFGARLPWVGSAFPDNFDRWTQLSLVLLGDPQTPLYTKSPVALQVSHAPSLALDGGPLAVTVSTAGGGPVAGAQVTLFKEGESFATSVTDGAGQAVLAWSPETSGSASLVATRANATPYVATVPVGAATAPVIVVEAVGVDDDDLGGTAGNGDGAIDAGETVDLALTVANRGGQSAIAVSMAASVGTGAGAATVTSGLQALGDLAAGASAVATHRLVVDPDALPGLTLELIAIASAQNGGWVDAEWLELYTHHLVDRQHAWTDPVPGGNGNGVVEAGEAIDYQVELRNDGVGEATAVAATLRVLNRVTGLPDPHVVVQPDQFTLGDVAPGTSSSGQFAFQLDAGATPEDLWLALEVSDRFGRTTELESDLTLPGPVVAVEGQGGAASITVRWAPGTDPDLMGYDVVRAFAPAGPFARATAHPVVGASFFVDAPLAPYTRYYYRVAARDSSGNTGPFSAVLDATTAPPTHAGWPQHVAQSTTSGARLADLEAGGAQEVVVGADCLYAWRADGTELEDGDGDPRTSGVFAPDGCDPIVGFRSDPALVDLDGDGALEIVATGWGGSSAPGMLVVVAADGAAAPGWPRALSGGYNWSSPAVGQLVADARPEIVTVSGEDGVVYAFHADGDEVRDGDQNPGTTGPFFATASAFNYGSPALGDLDGDLLDEIVVVQNSTAGRVFAIDADGTLLPGWPFETGGQITASPVIANLDGAGLPEVVVTSESDSVHVLTAGGERLPGWPQAAVVNSVTGRTPSPVVVDLDQQGGLEVVVVANDGRLHVWDAAGQPLPVWGGVMFDAAAVALGTSESTPTVGDIDGDGALEVVVGGEDGRVYAWNADATLAAGFPIVTGGEVRSSIAIGDPDGDGLVELVMAGWDQTVTVWDMPGVFDPALVPWPAFRHDLLNRGNLAGVGPIGVATPESAAAAPRVSPPRPNPFGPVSRFEVDLPSALADVRVRVLDVHGRVRRSLARGPRPAGRHLFEWDGRSNAGQRLAAGVYWIDVTGAPFHARQKIVLLQ